MMVPPPMVRPRVHSGGSVAAVDTGAREIAAGGEDEAPGAGAGTDGAPPARLDCAGGATCGSSPSVGAAAARAPAAWSGELTGRLPASAAASPGGSKTEAVTVRRRTRRRVVARGPRRRGGRDGGGGVWR